MATAVAVVSEAPPAAGRPAARLARLVSLVLHPFLVCPAAIVVLLWRDRGDFWQALRWAGLCAALVVLPALAWLALALRLHRYRDADVSVRGQRHGFYLFGALCMVCCYGVLTWLEGPAVLLAGFRAAMLAVLVGAWATRFWTKVSVHVGALAGVAAASVPCSWRLSLLLAGLAGLVAWARVVTGRHTVGQTVVGCLIALASVWLAFQSWR